MNALFIKATRQGWRYPSVKGQINTEQLWQLPLQNRDGFDLDSVAKAVNAEVKQQGEESFVTPTKTDDTSRGKLELVRYVIDVKISERDAAANAKAKAEEKQKILAILGKKADAALEASSEDELRKRLAALDDETKAAA